jgi:hypothetical protein
MYRFDSILHQLKFVGFKNRIGFRFWKAASQKFILLRRECGQSGELCDCKRGGDYETSTRYAAAAASAGRRTSALFTCLPGVAVKKKTGEENNEAHVAT